MDTEAPPAAGGNNPPSPIIDLRAALDGDTLRAVIASDFQAEQARVDELLRGFARFEVLTAHGIADDATAGRAADFIRQLRAAVKDIGPKREAFKKPVLDATRIIDGAFKKAMIDPLEAAAVSVNAAINVYAEKLRQAEAARRKAQADADEEKRLADARAEQARLAAAAAEAEQAGDIESAIEIESRAAEVAQAAAAAPPPPPPAPIRGPLVRSDNDSTISSRTTWEYVVEDIAKVPAHLLLINDPMVKAMLRTDPSIKKGGQPIPGIRFFEKTSSVVR
jgi:hypothetical protein